MDNSPLSSSAGRSVDRTIRTNQSIVIKQAASAGLVQCESKRDVTG